MQITDSLAIHCTPDEVVAALHNPDVLAAILPACRTVEEIGPGRFRAKVERKVGLLTLRLDPELTLEEMPGGLRLTIRAASRIAGSVQVDMALTLDHVPVGTRLAYDGQMAMTGLAARMLAERQDQLAGRIKALFVALKTQVEPA